MRTFKVGDKVQVCGYLITIIDRIEVHPVSRMKPDTNEIYKQDENIYYFKDETGKESSETQEAIELI